MPEPAVSIIIPCYNAADTVERAIESVRAQHFDQWELILVDDGSDDGTGELLARYAAKNSRIRAFSRAHAGVANTANFAIEQSLAPLIMRMDADDVSHPERVRRQVETLEKNPTWSATSCLVRFAGDLQSAGGYAHHVDWANSCLSPSQISLNRFVDLATPNPSLMFRREAWDRHGGYRKGDFPEDYEWFLRWLDEGLTIGKVPEVLYDWHDPPTRLTRNHPDYSPDAFQRIKAPYLARAVAKCSASSLSIWIWGAGRPTRLRIRALLEEIGTPAGFIDVDPNKIGRSINGLPVISPEQIPPPDECLVLSCVAARGAGQLIRSALLHQGRCEGRDFWLTA